MSEANGTSVATPRGITQTAAAITSTGVTVLPMFLTGALAVQIRGSLDIGHDILGLLTGSFLLAMGISSLWAGMLADRVGPGIGMRAGIMLAAIASLGAALWPQHWILFAIYLAVCGVANALAQSASSLLLSAAVPAARQGVAFGAFQSAKPLATMLAGLAVPTIGLTLGWQAAFLLLAVVLCPIAFVVSRPRTTTLPATDPNGTRLTPGAIVLLTLGLALGFAVVNSMITFLVDYAVFAGVPESLAGLLLSLGAAMAIIGRLLIGRWADRRQGSHTATIGVLLAVGAVGHALFASGRLPVILVGVVLACAIGWAFSGLIFLAFVRLHPAAPGTISGVALAGGSLGGSLGPVAFGLLVSHVSYQAAWLMNAGLSLAAAAAIVVGGWIATRAQRRALGAVADSS